MSSTAEAAGGGIAAGPGSVVGISDDARSGIVEMADGVGTNDLAHSGVAMED